ncbi:MAG: M50 family metallopeptidase [Candidatus Velthaea sp.]|jgi:regulator of sigma E protease
MTYQLAIALPTLAGLGKIIVFLVMISVLIVLHEYGHFIVARRNGVRVNDFALGMGPTLLRWTSPRSGTNYRLNLFPIGGYCAMKGEDGKTNEAEQQRQFRETIDAVAGAAPGSPGVSTSGVALLPERATARKDPGALARSVHEEDNFQAKRPLQRLAIVVAGPVMNFIVALVLMVVSYAAVGIPAPTTMVGDVSPGKPAALAGLRAGDRIVAVNGVPVSDGTVLVHDIQTSLGKPLRLTYLRANLTHDVTLTPVPGPDGAGHTVGIIGFLKVLAPQRVPLTTALTRSGQDFAMIWTSTFGALGGLFTHPAATAGQLHGVVGMASVSGEVQDAGWGAYMSFAALISISLGIFNLLPIPALDGGRGVFILAEMLRGKPVDPEKEALVHVGGFAVLIVLMLAVSYHDIAQIVAGKGAF